MTDLLAPIKAQIHKLWAAVDRAPTLRWATVTQAGSVMVRLDGDDAGVETPAQCPSSVTVTVGQRVVCAEQHRRLIVLA